MRSLEFLRGEFSGQPRDPTEFEYRLTCSGALYDSSIPTTDWTKSDAVVGSQNLWTPEG